LIFLLEVDLSTNEIRRFGAFISLALRMLLEKKRVSKRKIAFFTRACRFFHWETRTVFPLAARPAPAEAVPQRRCNAPRRRSRGSARRPRYALCRRQRGCSPTAGENVINVAAALEISRTAPRANATARGIAAEVLYAAHVTRHPKESP
jgi:hypothetical protein